MPEALPSRQERARGSGNDRGIRAESRRAVRAARCLKTCRAVKTERARGSGNDRGIRAESRRAVRAARCSKTCRAVKTERGSGNDRGIRAESRRAVRAARCLKTCRAAKTERARGSGGEAGIRTLGRSLSPYNGLANRRLQPLGHLTSREEPSIRRSLTYPERTIRAAVGRARLDWAAATLHPRSELFALFRRHPLPALTHTVSPMRASAHPAT